MSDGVEIAQLKLVTILASFELGNRIASDLRALGVSGYTKTKADGWGAHGSRQFGFVDGANVRLETLVSAELAHKILQTVAANFAGQAVVAFSCAVDAVPSGHFA
jgi:nitrogen regulatory protein P-II